MPGRDDLDDERLLLAVFRYRIIADALDAPRGARAEVLRETAERDYFLPSGARVHVTERTLQRWIRAYEGNQLAGLMRRHRKDAGKLRGVTEAAIERAIQLRKEQPARSTRTLIDAMQRAGEVAKGAIKRSTLDRHLDHRSASRRMLGVLGNKRHVRLRFEHPLDFVVGDFKAGPYVRTETNEIRRTELGSFIDHCTRYVPESRYGMAEDFMAVRRGLRAMCTAWGVPRKLYVDNGPGYQAGRFEFACAQLDIKLCHSKPYVSEGRGVIERFNRTVKDAFETEVRIRKELLTLDQLNEYWRAWLDERYLSDEHSETREAPRERWSRLLASTEVRRVDPILLDEVLRVRARRRVDRKMSTVEVGGVAFVVVTSLRGRWVDVLWDPHDLSSVLIYFDGRRIERATPQRPGEHPVAAPEKAPPPAPSIDYLELLRRDHNRRRIEQVSTIRFRAVPDVSAPLTITRLCEQLQTCTGRALGDVERGLAAAALSALAPVEIALADTALKIAVAQLGHGLHAGQYVNALREHVLATRKKGTP